MKLADDIPTCQQCQKIGVAVPDWMLAVEADLGADRLRAFLRAHAGTSYFIRKDGSEVSRERDPVGHWLYWNIGYDKFNIPLGPMSWQARSAWKIYQLLLTGSPNRQVALQVGCSERHIQKHKKKLKELGLLVAAGSAYQETSNENR
jgi:hypothetical protein